jgi:1-deoxy-D-xylulose-5-phosphate reductoisomerase
MKKIIVLGSTGSIGENTLKVAVSMPEELSIVAISCARNLKRLRSQLKETGAGAACVGEEAPDIDAPANVRIYKGASGLLRLIEETDADIVVNGIAGAAGLLPSMAALGSGKDLALANKESLVMAGSFLLSEASRRGRAVLPVDSEHAALFSLLRRRSPEEVAELILTASGGAFRDLPLEALDRVTVADALAHPTWKMGRKITVDSASMANKGLEIIEACRFFGVSTDRIRVLMHPQSLVHSIIRTIDGTLHFEASTTDMRIPIQNALTFPRVRESAVEWLELAGKNLDFSGLDSGRYPMVDLAYKAATLSPLHPIVYNAVNEVAVAAFMRGEIPFTGIPRAVERALDLPWGSPPTSVEGVLEIDTAARAKARELMI